MEIANVKEIAEILKKYLKVTDTDGMLAEVFRLVEDVRVAKTMQNNLRDRNLVQKNSVMQLLFRFKKWSPNFGYKTIAFVNHYCKILLIYYNK